jgi:hypothetical protein
MPVGRWLIFSVDQSENSLLGDAQIAECFWHPFRWLARLRLEEVGQTLPRAEERPVRFVKQ